MFEKTRVHRLVESSGNRISVRPGAYDVEAMKIIVDDDGRVTDIAKSIPPDRSFGLSMDLHRLTLAARQQLSGIIERHFVEKGEKDWFEAAFPALFAVRRFDFLDTGAVRWYEIDTPTDLAYANAFFSGPRIASG